VVVEGEAASSHPTTRRKKKENLSPQEPELRKRSAHTSKPSPMPSADTPSQAVEESSECSKEKLEDRLCRR
jgi:hypothetical protein